ncbi:alpha/beta hydrolase [Rhizobium leguminosarum]|uniref:Alpha/beta fold hydrolase n=1 Tax=Rhizobium indigoferae TaxID=158891 RepID=A0ABZ0ZB87_9HYPH|nr:alpha/beta fold hydrolase [Rhizobium indigoferae]NNU54832.1 alpha/beta fold hydrolase [Rhizobium indigoferae]WQN35892.1 alpha/beta fold hydrolase [Rhizobium indigoferae]GLR58374.1 alpha/beta hydrolase [Rhizobium indigoferae]
MPKDRNSNEPLEEVVAFGVQGERVVGTLRLAAGKPQPVILLFPGFGGVRDELQIPSQGKGIFAYIARSFASLGFSSLRIDFRGSGESDGLFENTTYSSQIADGIAAMEFLRSDPRVDGRRIFLLGWSQGGLVAAAIGGRTNRPSGIALWAAIGEPSVSFPALVGRETYLRGLAEESIATEIVMPWGARLKLRHPFFQEVATHDPFDEIKAYDGPLFVAEGSLDTAIPAGTGRKFVSAHNGDNELRISPMDHAFNTLRGTEALDALVMATANFFALRPAFLKRT